jgi:hypothetical protein
LEVRACRNRDDLNAFLELAAIAKCDSSEYVPMDAAAAWDGTSGLALI